jgi:hypothetical protein
VCRSGAFKFARLVPSCDVRYDFHVKLMCDSGHVLFVSLVFMFVYWCPTRFMWCSIGWPFRSTPVFCGVHVVLSLVFCIMFYGSLFVLFLLPFVLYVLLWFTTSDYPFGIFKLFSLKHVMFSVQENKQHFNIKHNNTI